MNEVLEEIVCEWSRRIPSGIINLKDELHINILVGVMNEYIGDEEIVSEWVRNIINN